MANPTGANQTLTKVYDSTSNALRVLLSGSFSTPDDTDAVTVTYPTSTTEVYAFRTGGVGGTVLMTLTLTYVNASKNDLLSVVKT